MFNLSNLLSSLVGIAIAISIHEFGHAYAAHLLGDDTAKSYGRMTVNPAAHIDPIGLVMMFICGIGWAKPVPVNANNFKNYRVGNVIVSLAGVLGNLVAAIVCTIIYKYSNMYALKVIFETAIHYNIIFGAFNLLPIPPLDGWGVISSVLPYEFNEFVHKYERYSFIILLAVIFTDAYLVVVGPIANLFYNIVNIFM